MGKRIHKDPYFLLLIATFGIPFALTRTTNGEYLIGVGSYDMTGPAAGVNMMGYANMDQNTAGIHFRLRARTFIVAESDKGARFAFVNLDAGMASQLVTIKVLERLKSRYSLQSQAQFKASKFNYLISMTSFYFSINNLQVWKFVHQRKFGNQWHSYSCWSRRLFTVSTLLCYISRLCPTVI